MTGIFILARLGSKRLPNKHLLEAAGKPFIEWMLLRLQRAFQQQLANRAAKIIICTSDEPLNKNFETFASGAVNVFYGSIHNIPLRLYECASANDIDHIVIIDGDDVLVSAEGATAVAEKLAAGIDLVKTEGLPFGLNSWGVNFTELKKIKPVIEAKQLLETGWGRYFDQDAFEKLAFSGFDDCDDLRFTLDYPEDDALFKKVIEGFGENIITATDLQITQYVTDHSLYQINLPIHKQYWENFNNEILKEKNEL